MRKRKKKSGFQKLTIFMAWFMAVITLLGVVATDRKSTRLNSSHQD